jgi:hypothetical protein
MDPRRMRSLGEPLTAGSSVTTVRIDTFSE